MDFGKWIAHPGLRTLTPGLPLPPLLLLQPDRDFEIAIGAFLVIRTPMGDLPTPATAASLKPRPENPSPSQS